MSLLSSKDTPFGAADLGFTRDSMPSWQVVAPNVATGDRHRAQFESRIPERRRFQIKLGTRDGDYPATMVPSLSSRLERGPQAWFLTTDSGRCYLVLLFVFLASRIDGMPVGQGLSLVIPSHSPQVFAEPAGIQEVA